MKKFTLGVILGSFCGAVLSTLKNEQGQRLGKVAKKQLTETFADGQVLAHDLKKVKQDAQKLVQELPIAKRAVTGISKDIRNYQGNTQRIKQDIQYKSEKLTNNLQNFTKEN